MRISRRHASLVVVLGFAVSAAACQSCFKANPPTGVQATTPLTILIKGGFKYVHTPADHQIEIAFLKDAPLPCDVKQLGLELTVQDGEIVVPATPPADMTFNPAGAVITFGDNAAEPLTVARGARPAAPFHPGNPDADTDWEDLQWVPSLAPSYPSNPLNPNWRDLVDGRVVLTHGKLVGAKPSDDVAFKGQFQFKRASDATTFTQSLTDRTLYTGQMPGDRVIINLAHAKSGISRIEIKPVAGRPVKLLLIGNHKAGTVHVGDVIKDYCAFYELMSPVPPMSERLLPVYIGDPSKPLAGQPTPGAYCPGEF